MGHEHYTKVSGDMMVRARFQASETRLICETTWKCTGQLSFPPSVLKSALGIQAWWHHLCTVRNTLPPQNEIPAMLMVRSIGIDIFK